MIVEILLGCNVDECPHNIGCVCRSMDGVAINRHGVCIIAGELPGFQKAYDKSSPKLSESFKEKALSIFVDEEGCPYPDDKVMKMAETMYDFIANNNRRF